VHKSAANICTNFFFLTFGDWKTSKSTDFRNFEFRQKRRNVANKKTKAETKMIIIITQLSVIDDVGPCSVLVIK
jgi:hypothetical protein